MADAGDSKSPALYGCVGSTPTSGTTGFRDPSRTGCLRHFRRCPGTFRLRRDPGLLRHRLQKALRDLSLPARRRPDVLRRPFAPLAEDPLERRHGRRELRDPETRKCFRALPEAPDFLGDLFRGLHGVERPGFSPGRRAASRPKYRRGGGGRISSRGRRCSARMTPGPAPAGDARTRRPVPKPMREPSEPLHAPARQKRVRRRDRQIPRDREAGTAAR